MDRFNRYAIKGRAKSVMEEKQFRLFSKIVETSIICPRCEGIGIYYRLPGERKKKCSLCNGKGKI